MNAPTATRTETEIESLRHDVTCWFARNAKPDLKLLLDMEIKNLPTTEEIIIDRNGDTRIFNVPVDEAQLELFSKWHSRLNAIIAIEDAHHGQ